MMKTTGKALMHQPIKRSQLYYRVGPDKGGFWEIIE
jgi:hypothetical protein